MNGNDDKELKKFFSEEFAKMSPSEGFEDKVMSRVEQARSRQVQPLIGTPLKIVAIVFAIALPVIFIALNSKVQGEIFSVDLTAIGFDGKKLRDFISGSSVVPISGIVLTYIALDVLWRIRKKKFRG